MISRKRLYLILVAVIGAFQIATINPETLHNEDACLFLAHARNLALNQPYGATNFIYTTETATYSPAEYPPVFPIMMAPIYRFTGLRLYNYKLMLNICLIIALLVIAEYYRKLITEVQLLAVLALLGFCPLVSELKDEILSDIPFLLFVYSLFLLVGAIEASKTKDYWVPGIFAGLFCYLAYGTRTIGMGLVPCIIIFGLLRHRRVARFSLVASVVFVALAWVQSRFISSNSDYFRMAFLDLRAPIRNLHFYVGTTSYLWGAGRGSSIRLTIFAIATCLCLIGIWRVSREPLDIASLFSIGYGLFLVFWPMHQGHYLLPLLPVYVYTIVRGLSVVGESCSRHQPSAGGIAVFSLACILSLGYIANYRASDFGHSGGGSNWNDVTSIQVYNFIRDTIPSNAVFVAGGPRALALYTGRRAARFPEPADKETLVPYISKVRATFLVASSLDDPQWLSVCKSVSKGEPIFSNYSYAIFKAKTEMGSNNAE